jgi:DNA-binding CsgD family transcriptional regulator
VFEYIGPSLIFFFASVILLLLRILALDIIWRWSKEKDWPAYIAVGAIWYSTLILLFLISTLLAVITLPLDTTLESTVSSLLWSLIILVISMTVLNFTKRITSYYRGQMPLLRLMPIIPIVFTGTIIVMASLLVADVWGVPTTPLLVLILAMFAILYFAVRETSQDYFAAFHLRIREQIRIGETLRLQNGEQGTVSSMGWHNVEMITSEGKLLIIPNSTLTKQIVIKIQQNTEAVKTSPNFFETQTSSTLDVKHKQHDDELISTLTPREIEVARLVSQGATNKELAKTLFITENTAKAHVKNILHKLEIRNRQQIAALTARQSSLKKG